MSQFSAFMVFKFGPWDALARPMRKGHHGQLYFAEAF